MSDTLLGIHSQVRGLVFDPDALHLAIADLDMALPEDFAQDGWRAFDQTALTGARVAITGWGSPAIDAVALESMPHLALVVHVGGSVRDIITEELWDRGVRVASAADVNNESVADFVAAWTLLAAKGALRASTQMKTTGRLPGAFGGRGIRGTTVGLVSFGSIARKVARRLTASGARVSTWDPFVSADDFVAAEVARVGQLEELFETCDVLSIHTPLIPGQTENLVGTSELELIKPGGVLINTSRGAVVAESELIGFLHGRTDVSAVLDVTVDEPPRESSPLFELPNIILTGHTAGSVGADNQLMGEWAIEATRAFLRGQDVPGEVYRDEAGRRA